MVVFSENLETAVLLFPAERRVTLEEGSIRFLNAAKIISKRLNNMRSKPWTEDRQRVLTRLPQTTGNNDRIVQRQRLIDQITSPLTYPNELDIWNRQNKQLFHQSRRMWMQVSPNGKFDRHWLNFWIDKQDTHTHTHRSVLVILSVGRGIKYVHTKVSDLTVWLRNDIDYRVGWWSSKPKTTKRHSSAINDRLLII